MCFHVVTVKKFLDSKWGPFSVELDFKTLKLSS